MFDKRIALLVLAAFIAFGDCTAVPKNIMKIRVPYTLFIGDTVTQVYNSLPKVSTGSNFYQVMQAAAAQDPTFVFTSTFFTGLGHYINSIAGVTEDKVNNVYWMIYVLKKPPCPNNPPSNANLSPVGVDSLIVQSGKFYLFWYKSVDLSTHT